MNSKSLVAFSSCLLVGAFVLPATLLAAPMEIRDAATNAQLVRQLQKSAHKNPLAKLNPKKVEDGQDPTKVNQPKDLIATSDFLSFQGMSTLIPKRSIIHIPKNYKSRIQFERGSNLVIWPTFFRSNRGWIKAMEVTREQAQGKEPFDEKVAENLSKSSMLVVATYKGGPISVLPYKDPNAPEENTDANKPKEGEKQR